MVPFASMLSPLLIHVWAPFQIQAFLSHFWTQVIPFQPIHRRFLICVLYWVSSSLSFSWKYTVKFHPCLRYGDGSHYHPYASLFIHSLGFHSNSNLSLFSSVPPSFVFTVTHRNELSLIEWASMSSCSFNGIHASQEREIIVPKTWILWLILFNYMITIWHKCMVNLIRSLKLSNSVA